MDPAQITGLLPHLELTDILRDPFRVYYRLVGTAQVHNVGFDYTGFYLDEIMWGTSDEAEWTRLFLRVCEERMPIYGLSTHPCGPDWSITHEFAIFPLSSNGTHVDKTINIEDYLDMPKPSLEPGWHRRGRRKPDAFRPRGGTG